jgi:hypothetical protein
MGMFDFIFGDGKANIDPNVGQQVTNLNNTSATVAGQGADLYKQKQTLYDPVAAQYVDDAQTVDSTGNQETAAGLAGGQVRSSFAKAQDANTRQLESLGINPGSGNALALNKVGDLNEAAQEADAQNTARENVKGIGRSMRAGVVQQGNTVTGQALNAEGQAISGYNSSGNLSLGVTNANLEAKSERDNMIGSAIGFGLGAWAGAGKTH